MINHVTLVGTSLPRLAAPLFPDILWRVRSDERVLYLTFDDGPNRDVTSRLIDILGRFNAKATFFLLGAKAENYPDLVRALVDGGHALGNHTYSHPDAWRTSKATVVRELGRARKIIEDTASRPIKFVRPPYGHFTPAMRSWCAEHGQRLTMWDLAPGDYLEYVSQDAIEAHVTEYVRRGSIIVLHDNPRCADKTPAALESILQRLAADGWRFEALSDFGLTR